MRNLTNAQILAIMNHFGACGSAQQWFDAHQPADLRAALEHVPSITWLDWMLQRLARAGEIAPLVYKQMDVRRHELINKTSHYLDCNASACYKGRITQEVAKRNSYKINDRHMRLVKAMYATYIE